MKPTIAFLLILIPGIISCDKDNIDDDLGIHHLFKYTFDPLNRLVLEESFMYNQELSSFTKYSYDDFNRFVKSEFYDHTKTMTSSTKKIYIGNGNLQIQNYILIQTEY
ncbi:MAG: hypothetical protein C0490_11915 [Marivirga sp.]|nr:hypothetical protein [Marivirga sp.]